MTGSARQILLEECMENVLGYEAPSADKPYKAYCHIKSNWGDDFNSIPDAWREIFIKICHPYLSHLS